MRFPLAPVGQDNSRSPQMFTSIFRRIFEEARSKRVWSISSTFEYRPFSLFLPFALSGARAFFRYLLAPRANETAPFRPPHGPLDLFAPTAKRARRSATRETSRQRDEEERKRGQMADEKKTETRGDGDEELLKSVG